MRGYRSIENNWFKTIEFIVDKSIGEVVVTDTVGYLPLFVGKSSDEPEESKRMVLLMDKVMSNSDDWKG